MRLVLFASAGGDDLMSFSTCDFRNVWKPVAVGAALVFMYSGVLWKLGIDWWSDDNYSHGLIVPFVIAYLVWHDLAYLKRSIGRAGDFAGFALIGAAVALLLAG